MCEGGSAYWGGRGESRYKRKTTRGYREVGVGPFSLEYLSLTCNMGRYFDLPPPSEKNSCTLKLT